MKVQLGAWLGAALVAACGAKAVDLGGDPAQGGAGGATASAGTKGQEPAGDSPRGGTTGKDSSGAEGGESGSVSRPPCGDGSIADEEACDDGNARSGDGCSPDCTVEPGWACSPGLPCGWICGDRVVAGPELCVTGACAAGEAVPPAPAPSGADKGPCDIYAEDGGPCVAAHSTVRALYATYGGPLYQIRKTDGTTHDIAPGTPGGLADSADQDTFCGDDACTISVIYDQSGQGNHLQKAPGGGAKTTPGNEANARAVSLKLAERTVYGIHIVPGVAYRNNSACGTATGDEAETEYMVVAGDVYNSGCCFDYGNVERDSHDRGEGAAEAVYFGATTIWGKGAGVGPWVMGDLENGLWAGDSTPYEGSASLNFKYVTAMLKGDAPGKNHWTLKSGNAEAGPLVTAFDGKRPSARYNPMQKQGGIGLGAAGDNSNAGQGNFFEGVMTAHYSSDAADAAVQANIVSVYGARR